MIKLIRMTMFGDWSKEQVRDFCLALGMTVVALVCTIFVMNVFVP